MLGFFVHITYFSALFVDPFHFLLQHYQLDGIPFKKKLFFFFVFTLKKELGALFITQYYSIVILIQEVIYCITYLSKGTWSYTDQKQNKNSKVI